MGRPRCRRSADWDRAREPERPGAVAHRTAGFGSSSAHRAGFGGRRLQHRDRARGRAFDPCGRALAQAVPRAGSGWALRRATAGPSPQPRRRSRGKPADHGAAEPARRGHALDHTWRGRGHRNFEKHGAALSAAVRGPTAPSRTFKLSTDPRFVEKVRTSSGSISIRRRTQSSCAWTRKARSRRSTAPNPSCRWGAARRSPTTTSGMAQQRCSPPSKSPRASAALQGRHRHQEFLGFLRRIDAAPAGLDVHVIVDNYATHKHPKVSGWLAQRSVFTSTTRRPPAPG